MKRRLLHITSLFAFMIIGIEVLLFVFMGNKKVEKDNGTTILALNEIDQLTKQAISEPKSYDLLKNKISELEDELRNDTREVQTAKDTKVIVLFAILCIIFLYGVFYYIYHSILKPFEKMKQYSEQIANGNFDLPLNYERSNYFGEFTWAFDQMRCEIMKSRSCEKEAIENNKTVIATLSHDIKTPIASIRAYAEGLEANLDTSIEKRALYTNVIMRKCDEVAALTNDLFLHSLSDLDKLQVSLKETELFPLLSNVVRDLEADFGDIKYISSNQSVTVMLDQKRFVQIIENLVNNARKYAKSKILITTSVTEQEVHIYLRDYGKGIPDDDMPFIFEKFYRGHNKGDEQGSGLGLYITRYLLTQMNGEILLHNISDGLEVTLTLPVLVIT